MDKKIKIIVPGAAGLVGQNLMNMIKYMPMGIAKEMKRSFLLLMRCIGNERIENICGGLKYGQEN